MLEASLPLAPLAQIRRAHVMSVLAAVGYSQTEAANVLNIDRKTIYRLLRKWHLDAFGNPDER